MIRHILAAVLLLAAACQAERFSLNSIAKLARVSDPQISPDGRSIACLVSRPNYDENTYKAQLVLIDTAAGTHRQLTQDRKGLGSPRWSPSGDRLAFLATGTNTKAQIFLLPMNGGEARELTHAAQGVQQFTWKPDGSAIAFATADEPPKVTGEERHNRSFEAGNDAYLVQAAPTPTHVWLISAEGGEARRLTSGSWSLPTTQPPSSPASPLAWSPDGRLLAYVKAPTPHTGDLGESAIQILDLASGESRALTGRSKYEGYPTFSPDGSRIAYWFPRDGETKNVSDVHVARSAGGDGVNVTRGIDRNIMRSVWLADSKSLLVGANDRTGVGLWVQPIDGAARRVDLGSVVPASAFWVDLTVANNGSIAFAGSEPLHPPEVYFMASPAAQPRRLTDFNAAAAALELGRTKGIRWPCPDGFECDGVLTFPPDFSEGRKYPLVLYVHGGPRAASKDAFSSRAQLLAAQGWVVFEPNYRGSDNLGNAFQAAIWNDAGDGPGRDVMAGVERLRGESWVDAGRIAVSGWSYGGYMTTWLIGHYPAVWRCAIAGAAVTDLNDQYNLGDANVRRGQALGGSPWKDDRMKAYEQQSPISQAHRIVTPTLILSDTGDARVTVTQSFKLFHALKDNGVETRMFLYPVSGHSPSDPVHSRDVDRRWIEWLAKYLNGTPMGASGGGR